MIHVFKFNYFNISAGHAPAGEQFAGAEGLISESRENRRVKDAVCAVLAGRKIPYSDCTVNEGRSALDIVKNCARASDQNKGLNIQLHFNAHASSASGTEVLVFDNDTRAFPFAKSLVDRLSAEAGFKNRGVVYRPGLAFLNCSKNPAVIIEICFCTSEEDTALYHKNYATVVNVIADEIIRAYDSSSSPCNGLEWYGNTNFIEELSGIFRCPNDKGSVYAKTIKLSKTVNNRHMAVWPVQKYLCSLGYLDLSQVDGIYGSITAQAVSEYQKDNGCVSDGIISAGKKTWNTLIYKGD